MSNTPEPSIESKILEAETIARKASKHKHPLSGGGFYASKFSEIQAEVMLLYRRLSTKLSNYSDPELKSALQEIGNHITAFFDHKTKPAQRSELRKKILFLKKIAIEPAVTSNATHSPSDNLFPLEIVRDTRGYIERVAEQACGSYDQGWYDSSSVMIRRLLETLIIETFEAHKLDKKIKNTDGTFYYLSGLIPSLLSETSWNIGRNARKALPKLKDLGDQSSHNRRYLGRKNDLDLIKRELRIAIEELVHLSGLKK